MKVYSKENCQKCNMVKSILKAKKIEFEAVDDFETVIKKAQETGLMEMPLLEIGDNIYSGTQAVKFVKGL